MDGEIRHVPVMTRKVIEYLDPSRGGVFFDGTIGDGGHTEAILEASEAARVIGVDQDPEALQVAKSRLERFGPRVEYVHANFADAAERRSESLAGALLDLGLSSRHLDRAERGFSFRPGTPLDMRMEGPRAEGRPTAADLLNRLSEEELADILYRYGEERRSRPIAREIVRRRRDRPFSHSEDLVAVLRGVLGPRLGPKDKARIFQALRVAVNDELGALNRALPALRERLAPGGTFVVLSYHSLEDRAVKNAFREWSRGCICPPELPVCRCRGEPLGRRLTRRPDRPTEAEVEANPRSRSARLRAWRKAA